MGGLDGSLIPCRDGEYWCPEIELETGKITNWEIGKTADIHYKVCDDGVYKLRDFPNYNTVLEYDGYVPDCLSIGGSGYGDYIILKIDENGMIADWSFTEADVKNDFKK